MATKKTRVPQTIDAYLASVPDPAAKKTLSALRAQLRKLLPKATETISYQMPAFKVDGSAVAGFAFFKNHCGYYPFSGGVVPAMASELEGYATSKSGVTFPPDEPLPAKLVKKLVEARLAEIATRAKKPTPAKKKAATTGFQVGVVRTLRMSAPELWDWITTQPERWLGAGATLQAEVGGRYAAPKRRGVPAVRGEVRGVKPGQRLRMTWETDGWKKPATLQLTVTPKTKGASLHVQMEKLPDTEVREAMRERWSKVLARIE
ncbi:MULTISPECIES: DUF1801 domain-containing protein [unclassified Corallococcus]|uniref:DUF1801 domain-containing protein n=1 Tax=unclassified Corallococcus TaxID=2685029 RepID=UPI001A8EA659|nr:MULTISPECIES: DUF1801 domain-containing protein [unclassified Corallococcus]MBN9686202.1 SRPBCC domain-containing protein [Corallococcus sp. NCSPR001]WAS82366.1 SRPBCC domain-containing protein [Corallococcus sp. NCRR]